MLQIVRESSWYKNPLTSRLIEVVHNTVITGLILAAFQFEIILAFTLGLIQALTMQYIYARKNKLADREKKDPVSIEVIKEMASK